MGEFYDYVIGLLGSTGGAAQALGALGAAPLDAPLFTGDARAVTAEAGDNDTSVATTEFADRVSNGYLLVNAAGAGTLALTAAQAGVALLRFSGVLTGNRIVTVPAKSGKWIVSNASSGTFPLTFKTPSGSGVNIPQGTAQLVFCDGANITSLPVYSLPSQTGQAGKALVSNGTVEAWGYPDQLATASGAAPSYAARAWGNIAGTGSVSVRAGGNVSSIGYPGTGRYVVNMTVPMRDTEYAPIVSAMRFSQGSFSDIVGINDVTFTPSSFEIRVSSTTANYDALTLTFCVYR